MWVSATTASRRSRSALAREPVDAGEEVEVLAHGQILVEREPLAHVADVPADRLALGGDVEAEHGGVARGGGQQAAQDPDQRRLARAVRSEQAVDLAASGR